RRLYGSQILQVVREADLVAPNDQDIQLDSVDIGWATIDLYENGQLDEFYAMVARSRSVKWVQLSGAGLDHPQLKELVNRGVYLSRGPDMSKAVAEFILRAVLDHLQDAESWRRAQRHQRWERHDFQEVGDTTWVVMGYGRIGHAI